MNHNISNMMRLGKSIIILPLVFFMLNRHAICQEPAIKREITLYNPYKPSLHDVIKKSFLPDMTDTAKTKAVVSYDITTRPYTPAYTISPLKAATMQPEALSKLYNGYIKLGLGNYLTPLAELSVTNLRSKSGIAGFYANHFSTNGNIRLDNGKKIFAGYMDNNANLYGRKFLRESFIGGNIGFMQKTRHAYGYNPAFDDYDPAKKDIRMNYFEASASAEISSMKTDSTELLYNASVNYSFFNSGKNLFSHLFNISAAAGKELKGFYVSSGIEYEYYRPSAWISSEAGYLFALSPSVRKKTADWNAKLGAEICIDKFTGDNEAKLHIYPDLRFGFSIIPSYLSFFAELSGKLEKNRPGNVVVMNPFIISDELYRIRNTSIPVIVRAGLEGETGIEGMYRLSASYSAANDYLLFVNYGSFLGSVNIERGNYFKPVNDDIEILNLKGETSGRIDRHFTFTAEANYYKYTLTEYEYAWGKPSWDARFILNYSLRDKITASFGMNATGDRHFRAMVQDLSIPGISSDLTEKVPAHINFSLGAGYRYTKILSFWLKINNISFSRYYEWYWYPSYRFICQAGFTYSL